MRVIELQEQTLIYLRAFAVLDNYKDLEKDLSLRTIPAGWPDGIVDLMSEYYNIHRWLLLGVVSPSEEIDERYHPERFARAY